MELNKESYIKKKFLDSDKLMEIPLEIYRTTNATGSAHLLEEYDGQTLSAFQTVGDPITPFVPLFNMVTNIYSQMLSIYENAKCNEKICMALLDRVEIAQTAVKSLQRKYKANEKNFRDQNYYYAWVRFVNVLDNIRKFSKEVTQLTYFQKFLNANAVKYSFEKNIKEFEEVCSDLNFTMALYNAEQKEMEAKNVAEDLEIMKKDEIKAEIRLAITEVTTLMSNANQLGSQIKSGNPVDKTAPRVDPIELSEPYASNDNVRGSNKTVHKKIFRGIEVACKKVQFNKVTDSGPARSDEKGRSSEILTLADIIRWLAPEKMRKPSKSQQQRYNHHSRPSDIEMQQKLKDLFNEHVFSKGISPQVHPKKYDSFENLRLEKVSINTDSQQFNEQFETPDELKAEPYIKLAALKGLPKAIQ
ncbi:15575_t:CDS:2, partial [Racocetra fulgida]